jgi:hypothetical protein
MAQKTIVQLIDDLDGSTSERIGTVTFGLDGVIYEIDLTEDNAATLRDQLAEFISSATRTGGRIKRGTASASKPSGSAGNRERTQAIREWARQNNWEISNRGRIPAEITEAYEAESKKGTKK